jgi:hypothetical protein
MASYETDFHAWTQEQAAGLRTARPNSVDWEHLAEVLDDMASSDLFALESDLARVIEHLLKLRYSPVTDPRNRWIVSVVEHRGRVWSMTARSGALARRIPEVLPDAWRRARKVAAKAMELYDGVDPHTLPAECPWTLEEILRDDWYPEGPRP